MKKFVTFFAAAVAAFALGSCQKETLGDDDVIVSSDKIKVEINVDGLETKAVKSSWEAGDKLNIWFDGAYWSVLPQLVLTRNADNTGWDASDVDAAAVSDAGSFFAVYEASNSLFKSAINNTYAYFPAVTTDADHGRTVKSVPMSFYANSISYSVESKVLKATIKGWKYMSPIQVVVAGLDPDDAKNYAMKVTTSASSTSAWSKSDALFYNSSNHTVGASSTSTGWTAGAPNEDGVAFYFSSTNTSGAKDVTFNLYDIAHKTDYSYTKNDLTVEWGYSYCKSLKIAVTKFPGAAPTPYLTFKADAAQTLSISKDVTSLEYSVGNGAWATLAADTPVTFGGSNGKLQLRGKSSTGTASGYSDGSYANISFGNSTPVACSGDIRTLVDYDNYETVDMSSAKFCYLFKDCTALTSANALQTKTASSRCYYGMFSGCLNLTSAPELPATTLQSECYMAMFKNCKSLTSVPNLPAPTLVQYCYSDMFNGCTNLSTAPVISATKIALKSCSSMFRNCTSLTSAPELNATELGQYCYQNMFNNCTSLESAPALPATTLADYCYESMFFGCTSLINAPVLPAETLAERCYGYMFDGCTKLGTVIMSATDVTATGCVSYMFGDGAGSEATNPTWYVLPQLVENATLVSNKGNFTIKAIDTTPYVTFTANATQTLSINKTVPDLQYSLDGISWTDLVADTPVTFGGNNGKLKLRGKNENGTLLSSSNISDQYWSVISFGNSTLVACSGDIRTLVDYENYTAASTSKARFCCLFQNCSVLTSAPELPATTLATQCYANMFNGCTSLTIGPDLPATSATSAYCYNSMFYGCTKLQSLTMKATSISTYALKDIFGGNAGSEATNPTWYVAASVVNNTFVTSNKGNFTVSAISN